MPFILLIPDEILVDLTKMLNTPPLPKSGVKVAKPKPKKRKI